MRGYRLETFQTIDSTNDAALQRAAAGDPGGLWLVAREQMQGRGRRGRGWSSPPGNLYASLLLIDPAPLPRLPELGFVAGVATASAVQALGLPRAAFAIKWPNDLVSAGAKFSGLLLETRQFDRGLAAVIGFGINCASHPSSPAYPTTDLSTIAGRVVRPAELFAALSAAMAEVLEQWDRGAGFPRIRESWLDFAAGLGKAMRVDTGTSSYEGAFETIDACGRLILRTSSGAIAIEAGDVFLGASGSDGAPRQPGGGLS